jgi:hypothetical protein
MVRLRIVCWMSSSSWYGPRVSSLAKKTRVQTFVDGRKRRFQPTNPVVGAVAGLVPVSSILS